VLRVAAYLREIVVIGKVLKKKKKKKKK